MKAVMISIQPKWVEKIANGEKTIEVRKTAPKIGTPFKCYVYATKSGDRIILKNDKVYEISKSLTGKVVGEFICDKIIDEFSVEHLTPYGLKCTCLTKDELNAYLGNKDGYGWHISDIKIYDKPKEISEFKRECDGYCFTPSKVCIKVKNKQSDVWANCNRLLTLTRPPQSWQYVEEL